MSATKKVVVLGSSFAGFTAAIELKNRLGAEVEVTVIAKSDRFVFLPSLIWVPFGLREPADISFELGPVLASKGVVFRHETIGHIDLEGRFVRSAHGHDEPYDYLVIATGAEPAWDEVPGLGPRTGHTQSIFSLEDALLCREAVARLLASPGPVVIGAAQGASAFGVAYELLFNLAHHLERHGAQAPLTYLTAEPYLGHLGLGGVHARFATSSTRVLRQLVDRARIDVETSACISHVEPDEVVCSDGRRHPFALAMIAPPFRGTRPVRALAELGRAEPVVDSAGFVRVGGTYQVPGYPEVYAAGAAVSMPSLEATPVPCGVPKTGYQSEEMARVVAHNIVADLRGEAKLELPPGYVDTKWILDAGSTGVLFSADRSIEPREREWLLPGPEAHWAKVAFEKLFLATHRRGLV
jgi:sulfide:quinone oxidoreductase